MMEYTKFGGVERGKKIKIKGKQRGGEEDTLVGGRDPTLILTANRSFPET